MPEKIGVGALKDIEVLFPGDIYELACFLLKVHDAKDAGTTTRSRHSVHGVAGVYANLFGVREDKIEMILKKHRLLMNAAVEYDEDVD
jgi:hypothetical protein